MPRLGVIERDFEKAVEIVKEEYPDVPEGSPQFWSLVFGVVKKMRGRKSARHLKYLGILEKADVPDSLFYLPYMFNQRVRGVDLLLDLPSHPARLSPTAFPSFPAAISEFVDTLRELASKRGWGVVETAERIIEHISENPLMLPLEDKELEDLLRGGVSLEMAESVSNDEVLSWQLVWIYAMLSKRIQPLTPRWGFKLAQITKDVKEKALKRIEEHLRHYPLSNIYEKFRSPFTLDYTPLAGNIVVVAPIALHESVRAILGSKEWRTGGAENYWYSVRKFLASVVPAWVAYALDLLGAIDLDDVLFISKTHITPADVLCAFADEKFLGEPSDFPIYEKPAAKSGLVARVKALLGRGAGHIAALKDEIIATISPRWFT